MKEEKMPPVHPGEILLEDFLKPMELSQNKLAMELKVPARRINEIVLGKRKITADTAIRLAKYFDMTPQFWLGLQMDYDLDVAEDRFDETGINKIKSYRGFLKGIDTNIVRDTDEKYE